MNLLKIIITIQREKKTKSNHSNMLLRDYSTLQKTLNLLYIGKACITCIFCRCLLPSSKYKIIVKHLLQDSVLFSLKLRTRHTIQDHMLSLRLPCPYVVFLPFRNCSLLQVKQSGLNCPSPFNFS